MKLAVTLMVFCVAALLALGLVMQYSSGMAQVGAHYFKMQLVWCGLGLAACGSAAVIDYRTWKRIVLPLLAISIVLLVLVYIPPIGIRRNGASRWVGWGRMSLFQPSELAKLALILALAWYGERFQRQMGTWKKGILVPSLFLPIVLGLIYMERDRGTTILLAGISGTMLLVAGVRWRYILPLGLVAGAGLVFSILHDPLRLKRVVSWLNPEETKMEVGYQADQAMIALGAGGWTGLGLGNGRQKLGFVPEQHTDFILSVIGEELGLVATLLVVAVFLVIFICGIFISLRAPDPFGLLLGTGITFLIGFQAFINIGVVTSALPNKGLPLPFISYGGSNLLIMLSSVGLLLSIARHARPTEQSAPAWGRDFPLTENPFRGSAPLTGAGGPLAFSE